MSEPREERAWAVYDEHGVLQFVALTKDSGSARRYREKWVSKGIICRVRIVPEVEG